MDPVFQHYVDIRQQTSYQPQSVSQPVLVVYEHIRERQYRQCLHTLNYLAKISLSMQTLQT